MRALGRFATKCRGRFSQHEFFVLPIKLEIPEFTDISQKDLEPFWRQIVDLQRHEDNLLNYRLQGLLVSTSFLVAAFAQFQAPSAGVSIRLGICLFGLIFALIMSQVLRRSALAIEWYLAVLLELEKILYREELQPYRGRRIRVGRLSPEDRPRKVPVMSWLGIWLPAATIGLWMFLAIWTVVKK